MDAPPAFIDHRRRKPSTRTKKASTRHSGSSSNKARAGLPPHQQSSHCIGCLVYDPHLFPVPVPFVGPKNVGVCRKHYMWLRRHFGLEKASLHSKCQTGQISSRCAKLLDQFKAHGIVFPLKPGCIPPTPPSRRGGRQSKASAASSSAPSSSSSSTTSRRGRSRSGRASRSRSMSTSTAPPSPPSPPSNHGCGHDSHSHHSHSHSHSHNHSHSHSHTQRTQRATTGGATSWRHRRHHNHSHAHQHAQQVKVEQHQQGSRAVVSAARQAAAAPTSPTVPPMVLPSPDANVGLLDFGQLDFDIAMLGNTTMHAEDADEADLELQAAERARQARRRADAAAMAVQRRARMSGRHGFSVTHDVPMGRAVNPAPQKRQRAAHGLPMYVPTAAKMSSVPPLLKPGTIPRHRLHMMAAETPKKAAAGDDADTATVVSAVSVAMGGSVVDYAAVADGAVSGEGAAREPVSSGEYSTEMVAAAAAKQHIMMSTSGMPPRAGLPAGLSTGIHTSARPAATTAVAATAVAPGATATVTTGQFAFPRLTPIARVTTSAGPLPDIQGGDYAALQLQQRQQPATAKLQPFGGVGADVAEFSDLSDLDSLDGHEFDDDSLRLWDDAPAANASGAAPGATAPPGMGVMVLDLADDEDVDADMGMDMGMDVGMGMDMGMGFGEHEYDLFARADPTLAVAFVDM